MASWCLFIHADASHSLSCHVILHTVDPRFFSHWKHMTWRALDVRPYAVARFQVAAACAVARVLGRSVQVDPRLTQG